MSLMNNKIDTGGRGQNRESAWIQLSNLEAENPTFFSIRKFREMTVSQKPLWTGSFNYSTWSEKKNIARALVGLSLSDNIVEQIGESTTAKVMWDTISDIFQQHTFNKLRVKKQI